LDFADHNEEVRLVWDAYRAGNPTRVPLLFSINTRYTMWNREANPRGITFEQSFNDPQLMLERQLEHQSWIRHHVPHDAEMGTPKDGWDVTVDLQNVYEAAWFGCPIDFFADQVPDTTPILLDDDTKRTLFDKGLPDPFEEGLMQRNREFYEYFVDRRGEGFVWQGKPLANVSLGAMGTDGPLTVACNLRGTEFLTDLLADPDYALELLEFITQATINRITAYRKLQEQPVRNQGWGFADDAVQLISTQMYEEMIYPFHKKMMDAFSFGGPNFIHLCGNATRHFPLLKEKLNIKSFDTGFPVDFGKLRSVLGPDVEIFGGPSVPFLTNASLDEVRTETRRVLDSGIMEGGRFVLKEGNNLAPEIGLPKLQAMYDTVKVFGRYT
jgi:hypothetical protein